jgi:hypothetical protein
MTNDDDRIAHLMGESADAVDEADRAALDDLRDLLADPAVWADPPDDLEGRIVASISAEAPRRPVEVDRSRRRHRPAAVRWIVAATAVAAALLVAAVAGGMLSSGSEATRRYVALAAVGAPGPSASATLTRTEAGWRIELDAKALPRLDSGAYYEAWLKNPAGTLVPVGTFNGGGYITLWAGVSPVEYATFSVTVEPADGNQASSGQQVLIGSVSETKK